MISEVLAYDTYVCMVKTQGIVICLCRSPVHSQWHTRYRPEYYRQTDRQTDRKYYNNENV